MQRLTSIAFGLSLVACGSSATTTTATDPVTRAQYDDTAQAIGTATANAGAAGSMTDSIQLALGSMPAGFSLTADGQYQGSRLGLDFSYDIACKDASGHALPACGPTTDSAAVQAAWSGSLETPLISTSVSRTGDWRISTLQSPTATFSGGGDFTFDAMIGATSYMLKTESTFDAVLVTMANHQVIGGSASFDVDGSTNGQLFEVHADVTFAAGTATILLDGDQSYSLDLSTGVVIRTNQG